ncbi:SMC-Scp complex subunit ScpB [Anatilimnocola sp. NA78]|uniref:SMC-Scp complex subunit ScpB n=1 Tax=Anatilimnocola sp. NA78 TaxID=3415683 RepID=UPI003CE46922
MRQISTIPAIQLKSSAARYSGSIVLRTCATVRPSYQQPILPNTAPQALLLHVEDEDELRHTARQRLEAVLFLAREPLNTRKLSQYANLADGTEARTLIRHLNEHYDAAGRAFRVEQVAGGFQLMTRRLFSSWLRRLGHVPPELRLSAPALETLAVIAYRQPTPRADIEAIRGVNCGEVIRQLMERDLVRIGSRSEELGRPYLYNTTKRFLQLFGLVNLDDLPRAQEMKAFAAAAAAPNPNLIPAVDSLPPLTDVPYTDSP